VQSTQRSALSGAPSSVRSAVTVSPSRSTPVTWALCRVTPLEVSWPARYSANFSASR